MYRRAHTRTLTSTFVFSEWNKINDSPLYRVGCKAGSPSWAPPSSEQFPPPWERCLNGLLFVTFCAVPLKFNKYYVIKKLADIFVLSILASLIHVLEHYATYSFY